MISSNSSIHFCSAGMTGSVVLDDGGDREPDYWITDMNPYTGYFVKIAEILNKDLGVRVSCNQTHNYADSIQVLFAAGIPQKHSSSRVAHW